MHDEFEKIAWLKARFELGDPPDGSVLGIGDDAAVFDFGERPTVVTVDTHVEGIHFRRDWLSPSELGARAMIAAVSDVYAMAAQAVGSVVALTLPPKYPEADFRSLIDGLADAARATGAAVIGGNLSGGPVLSITTTAFGHSAERALTRRGARVGDRIYATGALGASALGFRLLEAGRLDLEHAKSFIDRWRRPPIRAEVAGRLSDFATAAIDVSDACLQDLGHICRASEVGATLDAQALPTLLGFAETCAAIGADPLELALTGGEDYEILFTAAEVTKADAVATQIGVITADPILRVLDADGCAIPLRSDGFRHFS
jgi:thiamine-monophosphate kinase